MNDEQTSVIPLAFSSLLFFIPGLQALRYQVYDLSIIYLISGTVSCYYWATLDHNALILDKLCANVNLAYSFYKGCIFYKSTEEIVISSFFLSVTIYLYIYSCYLFELQDNGSAEEIDVWIIYHIFFHVNCAILKGVLVGKTSKVYPTGSLPYDSFPLSKLV